MTHFNLCKGVIILTLVLVSGTRGDWSWGTSGKSSATPEIETDKVTPNIPPPASSASIIASQSVARSSKLPEEILPLEGHSSYSSHAAADGNLGDEGRSGRFLGISDKLCDLGVKGMCNKKGYPPASPSHYGGSIDNSFGNSYNNYAAPPVAYPSQNVYPAPYANPNAVPPKKSKPSKGLFGGLFKKKKNKESVKQSYGPPPTYISPLPEYNAPKPVYKPLVNNYGPPNPVYQPPVPSYSAPQQKPYFEASKKVFIEPKPFYESQNANFDKNFNTFDAHKPKDVVIHKPHGQHSIPTHVIAAVKPSKVEHIHTHTHIYKQNPGFDIRNTNNFPRDDGNYQASSQVKTTLTGGSSFPIINVGKTLPTQIHKATPIKKSFDSFTPSQSVPFISGFQANQEKRHIAEKANTGFNSFGTQNQHQQNSFQTNIKNLATSGTQNQHQQNSFQTNIKNLATSFANNGLQRTYAVDCQCVPRQYCALEDLVARSESKEIGHLLDARNEKTDIVSNATLPEDYYDYDYIRSDNNATYEDYTYTTLAPEADNDEESSISTVASIVEESSEATKESSRVRRDVKKEVNSTDELEGRQLTGFAPGLNGCGEDYVCCRRPVYIAAKRSSSVCGKGNPSIHGRVSNFEYEKGQSDFGEYPWQGAILRDEGIESMFVCGATLIDERHVLTAAHCVNDLKVETLKVRLGEWDVNRDTEFYKHIEVRVSGVFVHPEFYKGNLYNDIAILRLEEYVDVDSNPHISPVCLPATNTDFTNYRCQVTGWGKDAFGDKGKFQHILKELDIPVVDHKTCEYALQSTRLGRDYKLHDGFICAGGEEGKDACKGDGGGPLVCSTGSKTFQLAGVVSWGIGCGQRGIPGIYVNIPHYVEWIRSVTTA